VVDADLLERIRTRRGYLLSYHVVYAALDAPFLDAFDRLYNLSILEPRFLAPRERELIWVGIVTLAREEVGEIHLQRAKAAGASARDIRAAMALAGVVEAWRSIEFGATSWPSYVEGGRGAYLDLFHQARGELEERLGDLIALVLHAAQRNDDAFSLHLQRLVAGGADDPAIAEAVSYLLHPLGANALLWATDHWLAALRTGAIPPSSALGTGELPASPAR
jgi:alkylhydroperoxidase/carboxymuconolactone decarboxylase family protein YurZ